MLSLTSQDNPVREVCIRIIVIVPILQKTLKEPRSDPPRSKLLREAEAKLNPGSPAPSCNSVVPLTSLQRSPWNPVLPASTALGWGRGWEGGARPSGPDISGLAAPDSASLQLSSRRRIGKKRGTSRCLEVQSAAEKSPRGNTRLMRAELTKGCPDAGDKRIEGQRQARAASLVACSVWWHAFLFQVESLGRPAHDCHRDIPSTPPSPGACLIMPCGLVPTAERSLGRPVGRGGIPPRSAAVGCTADSCGRVLGAPQRDGQAPSRAAETE